MGNKKNRSRTRKRKFQGNQNVCTTATNEKKPKPQTGTDTDNTSCLRYRKLQNSFQESPKAEKIINDYNIIVNNNILKEFLTSMVCPECLRQSLEFRDDLSCRMGYAHKLSVLCQNCGYEKTEYSSKQANNNTKNQGRRKFDINIRTVIAFREIGKGLDGIQNTARCLNMYTIEDPSYRAINEELLIAYETAADISMTKAASEVKAKVENVPSVLSDAELASCQVSIDGTWQKRGHSSLNGVVTAMSEGKCVDIHVLSKHCKRCKIWEQKKNTPEYEQWKTTHQCYINHEKSSGSMEAAGAVEIFQRSIQKNKLVYSHYLGDGDTSSFKEVVDSKPYDKFDIVPEKVECVGHVQKRLGTRLRNKIKEYKGTKTPLSGKGKLTDKVINSMQNYYGMAIRQNSGNLFEMKKSVGAILWHCTDLNDSAIRHQFCPKGELSWCKFQKDKATGNETYKANISIPKWIHDIIKPVFVELSANELLSKCLHGGTQNSNESLHNVIWVKCPKTVFVSKPTLEIAVYSAVIEFNEGSHGINDVFNNMGLASGSQCSNLTKKRDTSRVKKMIRKSSDKEKKKRKTLRGVKKGYLDKQKELEPQESYIAGGY